MGNMGNVKEGQWKRMMSRADVVGHWNWARACVPAMHSRVAAGECVHDVAKDYNQPVEKVQQLLHDYSKLAGSDIHI